MKRRIPLILLGVLAINYCCGQQARERTAHTILEHFLKPSADYVLIAAHRGDWRNAPENSIHALDLCLKMGIDIMETDVRKTSDVYWY